MWAHRASDRSHRHGCTRAKPLCLAGRYSFQPLPDPRVSGLIALDHKRLRRFTCLLRVTGVEWRGGVIFDPELDGLCDLGSGKFGNDAEGEVYTRSDAAR